MALGNVILITPEPKGRFEEIIVVGTPKPGTHMVIKPGTTFTRGGRCEMEPAGTTAASSTNQGMNADGERIPIAILLCATDAGASGVPPFIGPTDAYTTGSRGTVYYPVPGDEMNILFQDNTGTGALEDIVIGSKLIVDDGTGKVLQSTGSPECEPWVSNEAVADVAADRLIWATFTAA